MKSRMILVAVVLFLSAAVNAQMLDLSAGAEKKINKQLSVEAEVNYRSLDGISDGTQRYAGEVGLEYGFTKWLKGVASYSYIRKHYTDEVTSKGNLLNCYWRNNNRVYVGLQGGLKAGRFSFALREGLQYTYMGETETTKVKNNEKKVKEAKESYLLRSRFKAALNIKRTGLTPFLTVEAYNDTKDDFSFAKMRYTVGTDYKLNKTNVLTIFYRYIDKADEEDADGSMIGIGYTFKMK